LLCSEVAATKFEMKKPTLSSPKQEILINLESKKLIGYDEQYREMRGKSTIQTMSKT
jgi:hypothetical protein